MIAAASGAASLVAWLVLVFGRGRFWRTDYILPGAPESLEGGDDGTAEVALRVARGLSGEDRLTVVIGEPISSGWAGKVWALHQGVNVVVGDPEYLWFTDADVLHPRDGLIRLVSRAGQGRLDLASVMVQLLTDTWLERLLIPAFVYFFGKLYPFSWSNDPRKETAAAAGGCILVRRRALEVSGGLPAMSDALIDDCTLAARIKREGSGRTWLGLSRDMRSVRGYDGLTGIWSMVARTAFTQLRYSPILLAFTVFGMLLIYAAPLLAAVLGVVGAIITDRTALASLAASSGAAAWLLMAASFMPMLRWYGASILRSPLLVVAGVLYTGMTIDSALRH